MAPIQSRVLNLRRRFLGELRRSLEDHARTAVGADEDGKRIVYGAGHSPSAEIWLFENFWPVQTADKKVDRRQE